MPFFYIAAMFARRRYRTLVKHELRVTSSSLKARVGTIWINKSESLELFPTLGFELWASTICSTSLSRTFKHSI